MSRANRQKRTGLLAAAAFFLLALLSCQVWAQAPEEDQTEADTEKELLQEQEESQEALLEGLELGNMQDTVNALLGEETFSIRQVLESLLQGEEVFSLEFFWDTVREFLSSYFLADKRVLFQVILLVLLAAIF